MTETKTLVPAAPHCSEDAKSALRCSSNDELGDRSTDTVLGKFCDSSLVSAQTHRSWIYTCRTARCPVFQFGREPASLAPHMRLAGNLLSP